MPRHQYPRQVEIVDDLPKSETGEILRAVLRAQESAKLRGQSQGVCWMPGSGALSTAPNVRNVVFCASVKPFTPLISRRS